MTDPLEPSAEYSARMDQIRAATREAGDLLRAAVAELVDAGWTDEQARALVAHLVTTGSGRP